MEILSELGMKVEEADDGTVAVEKCIKAAEKDRDTFYDFILMDVQMPVMDGYEATQKIRKLGYECTDRVPIIAMTANAFAEDKKNAFVAGMNAHLAKPIDMKELIRTLLSFAK